MAGSERPTDDVLGHGKRLPPEDETTGGGDDRGHRVPDDVEGHMPFRQLDTEAVDEDQVADDTAGHGGRYTGLDTEATDEDQAGDDDTGGHVFKYRG